MSGIKNRKPNGYWNNKELCLEEALKYETRNAFKKGSIGAHSAAVKHGWIEEAYAHMDIILRPRGYWTKERCAEEAKKYTLRKTFNEKSGGAYNVALREKWLDEICSHMEGYTPVHYWTKERCAEEAKKYESRTKFKQGCSGAVASARKNGWMDEICSHMKPQGHLYKRLIYAIFINDIVYVGLTCNIRKRIRQHVYEGYIFKQNAQDNYDYIVLTEYLPIEEAKEKEAYYVEQYKKVGWKIGNTAAPGSLGNSFIIWTKEKCAAEAKKYKTRTEFREGCCAAEDASRRHEWIDEICLHMKPPRKRPRKR